MSLNRELSKNPVYRFLTLCTMYLFFFNTISMPVLQYAQVSGTMAPPRYSQTGESWLYRLLTPLQEFFVGTAEAADDIQTSISPTEFSVEKQAGVPRSAGDMSGDNGASGSVNLVVGSYGYTYPITVPPGRGGFAPTLALNYSSSGPNGSIGLGWDLSLGSISRSTKYGKPDYDDDDTFVISIKGSSIMMVREGDQYRLKDEGLFLRIIKDGEGWVATDKDGTEYYFGTTEESRQIYSLFGTFKWCLDRIRDANGNEIHIIYQTDHSGYIACDSHGNNQIYPIRINYDLNNSIQFIYDEDRPDAFYTYSSFFKIKTAWRLEKIIVRGGPDLSRNKARTYQLEYEEDEQTRQSLLKKITLIGAEENPMPPTGFPQVGTAFQWVLTFSGFYDRRENGEGKKCCWVDHCFDLGGRVGMCLRFDQHGPPGCPCKRKVLQKTSNERQYIWMGRLKAAAVRRDTEKSRPMSGASWTTFLP